MEATSQCVPAITPCFLHVTARAAVLVFLFLLQQNDVNNLEHMEAFPHCKLFWGGKMWFANPVKWKRHFQMLLRCSNTSLCVRSVLQMFCFACFFLFKSLWLPPSRIKKCKTLVPLVIAPGRQEDTLRLLFLYPQLPHRGLFHYPQATTWCKWLDIRKKKRKRLQEHSCIQDDTWGSWQNKQLLASISMPLKADGMFHPEARRQDFPWWVWSESLWAFEHEWVVMGVKGTIKTAWLWMPDWWWDRGTELLVSQKWILNSFLNRTKNKIGKIHYQECQSINKRWRAGEKKNLCLFTDGKIKLVTYQWTESFTLS